MIDLIFEFIERKDQLIRRETSPSLRHRASNGSHLRSGSPSNLLRIDGNFGKIRRKLGKCSLAQSEPGLFVFLIKFLICIKDKRTYF